MLDIVSLRFLNRHIILWCFVATVSREHPAPTANDTIALSHVDVILLVQWKKWFIIQCTWQMVWSWLPLCYILHMVKSRLLIILQANRKYSVHRIFCVCLPGYSMSPSNHFHSLSPFSLSIFLVCCIFVGNRVVITRSEFNMKLWRRWC